MADQQKMGLSGWFFEVFQQCIGGCDIQCLSRTDHNDFPAAAMAGNVNKIMEFSNLLDADPRAGLGFGAGFFTFRGGFSVGGWGQNTKIGVCTRRKPATGTAGPAGQATRNRLFA